MISDLRAIVKNQKTIRTSKLHDYVESMSKTFEHKEALIKKQVKQLERMNQRYQREHTKTEKLKKQLAANQIEEIKDDV